MSYARVLIATDFSDCALQAARQARLVVGPNAEYRCIHVLPPKERPGYFRRLPPEATAEDVAAREARVKARMAEWWKGVGDGPLHGAVRVGDVTESIAAEAKAFGADLVVFGAHGRGAIERLLLGSTARRLLRGLAVDTLVVPSMASDVGLARVVLATDFFPSAQAAARRALAVAAELGVGIEALHVIDDDLWDAAAYDRQAEGRVDKAWLEKTVREMLHEFNVESLEAKATESLRQGRPAAEVARATRPGDLLLVGQHGAGRIERAIVGSVAEAIVERSEVPVLVVRQ